MTSLRISAIQMPVTSEVTRNTDILRRALQAAHDAQADILLTPEGALSGYRPDFDPPQVEAALSEVTALARQLGVGLALGTCCREPDGRIYDALRFYAPDGTYLGFHSKILLCGTLSEPTTGEINDYATTPLRVFQFGGITIGGLICNDLWANPQCTPMPDPHLTQQLSRLGARVIFHAVNGGRDGSDWSRKVCWNFHESNLRMRAAAGGVWIVTVDSSQPIHLPCSAPGGVIDPRGEWVCRAEPQGEQFFVHTLPL